MFKQLTIGLLFAISQWNLQSASINVIRYTVVIDDQQLPHTVTSINWLVLEIGTITDGLLLRKYLNLTHFTPGFFFGRFKFEFFVWKWNDSESVPLMLCGFFSFCFLPKSIVKNDLWSIADLTSLRVKLRIRPWRCLTLKLRVANILWYLLFRMKR